MKWHGREKEVFGPPNPLDINMNDVDKTQQQLIDELNELRLRIGQLEKFDLQRGQIKETLRDSEQRYRQIVDTADEGIWVFDKEYATTFVNRRMADMLGCGQEEMPGRNMASFLFHEDLSDFRTKAARRGAGIAERYERRLKRKDGEVLWALVSATPIMNAQDSFQGSFAMFTDITERKQAEEALLLSETKFRSIFEHAVEGMFQSTPEGRLITVNPSMARIFSYDSPDEMVSKVTNIGHQLYSNSENRRTFKKLLENRGIAGGFEAQFLRKDGTVLWGSLNVRAVKNEGGNILHYEGALEDITGRKHAEEALRKSEEKYRNIFENAVEGIFQVTPSGRYLSANPAVARIHGYGSPEEMIQSVTDIARQLYVDPGRRLEMIGMLQKQGSVKDFEVIMRRKDGSLHWVSLNAHAILDPKGSILYYEGTVEDITSRKLAEEELKQLSNSLEGVLAATSLITEMRVPATSGHQKRVSHLAGLLATGLKLTQDMAESVRIAGLIHDIGKVAVPIEILNKPSRLTEMEFEFIKVHPRSGYEILKDARLPYPVAEIVLQHHERLNGSGYPQGLSETQILLEARVLAVADVVETMSSARPYRAAPGLDAAMAELRKNRAVFYDPEVVDTCLKLFKEKKLRTG
jgi:PAS domain S-box-containing protein/putative nucleotidyltransferase with HDIG domain